MFGLSFFVFCLTFVSLFESSLGREPTKGIQSTWIPVQWGTSTEAETQQTIYSLAKQGVNRIYVDVWNQGKTYFNSTTMYKFVGSAGISRDLLSWAVKYAKQYGLEVFAWFEYGCIAAYSTTSGNAFATQAQKLGWIKGQTSDKFIWLNVANNDAMNFLAGILIDAATLHPDLTGVQLDDHFAWPVELGGSNTQLMTNVATSIRSTFRAVSNMSLSLAPNPLDVSISKYNVDWKQWSNIGLFTEYAPQLYTSSYSSFQTKLTQTLDEIPDSVHPYMLAGIRCDGSGSVTAWSELSKMISLTVSYDLGVAVWYGHCILEVYPTQFASLWGSFEQNKI